MDASFTASPVIFLLKVADGDEPRAAADSKLVLLWRPLNTASSTVDPEDDQGGLPGPLFKGPHVSIAVCSTGDYTVTLWGPVDPCVDIKYILENPPLKSTPIIF